MPSGPVVEARSVSKAFGRRVAVADVSFSLGAGDCLALFGPNGAGKTTLLRLVAGLLKPSAGEVTVRGESARRDATARGAVGLVSHHSMLYPVLTARENVEFAARLFGVPSPAAAAAEALAALRAADSADTAVRRLSRGQQQRVSIARAIVHGPSVLLLDEPYSGLDEAGAAALTVLLQSLGAGGAAIVLVTHNLGEGLALATHAAIMSAGRFARFEARGARGFDAQRYAADYRALVAAGEGGRAA